MENVSLLAAFFAGLLSFVSPCVLPLIPGYLSFISGVTLDEMRGAVAGGSGVGVATVAPSVARRKALVTSIAFVLGFSLVFVAIFASASAVGQLLGEWKRLLGKAAGVIVIVLGLHTMGVFRIPILYNEKRVQTRTKPTTLLGALLVGCAFAFGWTPCLGPILAGVIAFAEHQETVTKGVRLLAAYSLGLGIPFVLTSVAINQFFAAFARIRRHYHKIELASGALLVIMGALMFTDRLTIWTQRYLAPYVTKYLPLG
jgi:cytochrome c-type biogenesis protein